MLIRVIPGALIGALPGLLLLILSVLSPNGEVSTRIVPGFILMAVGGYVGSLYAASMRN